MNWPWLQWRYWLTPRGFQIIAKTSAFLKRGGRL